MDWRDTPAGRLRAQMGLPPEDGRPTQGQRDAAIARARRAFAARLAERGIPVPGDDSAEFRAAVAQFEDAVRREDASRARPAMSAEGALARLRELAAGCPCGQPHTVIRGNRFEGCGCPYTDRTNWGANARADDARRQREAAELAARGFQVAPPTGESW